MSLSTELNRILFSNNTMIPVHSAQKQFGQFDTKRLADKMLLEIRMHTVIIAIFNL